MNFDDLKHLSVDLDLDDRLTGITPEVLAEFNIHNLHDQYAVDLKFFAFFQLLEKEVIKQIRWESYIEDRLEAQTYNSIQLALSEGKGKATLDQIKKHVLTDTEVCKQKEKVIGLKNHLDTIQGILDVLKTKAIALNVLVARDKAEVMSGLR